MKIKSTDIRAHWNENFRTSCHMNGAGWLVEIYDRFVQGESVETLKQECRTEIDEQNDRIENRCLTRDRYGHTYTDHEAQRWARARRDERQRALDRLEAGTFAPPYTIQWNGERWDITTIRRFEGVK